MHAAKKKDNYEYVNKGISFVEICTESEEIDLFLCESLQEIISYKWNHYGKAHHLVGFSFHILYMVVMILYVNAVYI